ncbi:MAG: T9SS type A sorting domain-containing protein [Bacteroidia bacterium]|jgi:hypothetical protein|nr:T9SS type A sorting domain-containing protein [Bacteroidia bacterium]
MKKFLLALLFSAGAFTAQAQIAQILADTSIELSGSGSSTDWTSTSTNFMTVFCDAGCGNCNGPCAPASGSWYAWFGGSGILEVGTLTQTFTIPSAGPAVLRFLYYLPTNGGVVDDSLMVDIDGNVLWATSSFDSAQYNSAYTAVTITIPALTAGSHVLNFSSVESGNGASATNMLVDDITLLHGTGVGLTEILFDEGITISQNPVMNALNVAFNLPRPTNLQVMITDMSGRVVNTANLNGVTSSYVTFNTLNLSNGIYNVTINDGKSAITRKVLIQN